MNLCAYSALFGRILDCNEEDIRTVALAGLLGSIGLAGVPSQVQMKSMNRWTKDEKEIYLRYPIDSVLMIKRKKVPLSVEVAKVIEQHRELLDGSGHPNSLKGTQVSRLARIVSIADKYQPMTALQDDKPNLTPLAAIERLISDNTKSPKMPFDAVMLQKLQAFFKMQAQKHTAKAA